MSDLRCKVCGGRMIAVSDGVYECESCGRRELMPIRSAARPANELLSAADELRNAGDFDSAYLTYQNVLAQDPGNVVARWKLALCRFGIRYEKDPLTGASLPTLNRMRYDSILEDPDYVRVLASCNDSDKQEFQRRAEEIARIQQHHLDVARSEQPYDVFISFKAEDEGQRTRDSVIAQEIYDRLTERGIRTFYSRVTLQDKSGTEYEPYIFAALQSARLLLLVATSPEHANAVWVKNEWSRYLDLMTQDREKHLLPVYEGMERDAFPPQIPVREALDYAQDGALAEVVQGVLTLTGLGTVVDARDTRSAIPQLVQSLQSHVEHERWREAREVANEILDLDAENGDAYFYLLLSEYHASRPTKLADLDEPWDESRSYQRAMRYAQPTRQQLLEAVKTRRDMRKAAQAEQLAAEAERTRKANETDQSFLRALDCIQEQRYREAIQLLQGPAHAHPDAQERITWCSMALKAQQDLNNPLFLKERIAQQAPGVLETYSSLKEKYLRSIPNIGEEAAIEIADQNYLTVAISIAMAVVALITQFKILPFWPAMIIMAVLGLFAALNRDNDLIALGLLGLILFTVAILDYGGPYEHYDKRETFSMFFMLIAYLVVTAGFAIWRGNRVTSARNQLLLFVEQVVRPLEDNVWDEYVSQYEGYDGIVLERPISVVESI